MRTVRSYLTVDGKATALQSRRSSIRLVIRGRFQIASAIMPRFEIYGRAEPSGTYRHLFIVTGNHLLQPASLSSFLFLPVLFLLSSSSFLRGVLSPCPSLSSRQMLLTPDAEDDHPRYRVWECGCEQPSDAISCIDRNATSGNLYYRARESGRPHARNYVLLRVAESSTISQRRRLFHNRGGR